MKQIQWLIPTTTFYFTTWFKNNWERFRTIEYDSTPTTHVIVLLQNPNYHPNNEHLVVIHIDATSTYENSEKGTAIGYPDLPGEVITIKVIQVDKERIELDVDCTHDLIWEKVVLPFLDKIKHTWNLVIDSEQQEQTANSHVLANATAKSEADASLIYNENKAKRTTRKPPEPKRVASFPLDVIDAATYRALQKLHIPVRQIEEDDSFIEIFERKKYAVREVLTLGSVFYHWFATIDGELTGFGGIQLRKRTEDSTEILFIAPISRENQIDSFRWSLTISKLFEEEGYLSRKPRAVTGSKEKTEGQAKTFVDEPWPTNPGLLKPHLERIVISASQSAGPLNGIHLLHELRIGEYGKQYCIGWDNFSMLGHIEIVPTTNTLSRITITSYDQGNFPEWQQLADDFLAGITNELKKICMPEKAANGKKQMGESPQPFNRLLNSSEDNKGALLPDATILGGNNTGGTVYAGTTNQGEHFTLIVSPDGSQKPIQDAAVKVVNSLDFHLDTNLKAIEKPEPERIKSKRGPRRYPLEYKQKLVRDWENLDRDIHGITLQEFLSDRTGTQLDGSPNVAPSTFYKWRNDVKKSEKQ